MAMTFAAVITLILGLGTYGLVRMRLLNEATIRIADDPPTHSPHR
jgi:hypothetical protein